jgi:dUTP pyrophosphatase
LYLVLTLIQVEYSLIYTAIQELILVDILIKSNQSDLIYIRMSDNNTYNCNVCKDAINVPCYNCINFNSFNNDSINNNNNNNNHNHSNNQSEKEQVIKQLCAECLKTRIVSNEADCRVDYRAYDISRNVDRNYIAHPLCFDCIEQMKANGITITINDYKPSSTNNNHNNNSEYNEQESEEEESEQEESEEEEEEEEIQVCNRCRDTREALYWVDYREFMICMREFINYKNTLLCYTCIVELQANGVSMVISNKNPSELSKEQTAMKSKADDMDRSVLFVKKLHESAILPVRGSNEAAGYDLACPSNVIEICIPPGTRMLVPLAFAVYPPQNTYCRIAARSGLSVQGIDIGAGVIDPDYNGEIKVLVINNSKKVFKIKQGDRIAQMILESYKICEINEVDELPHKNSKRGNGGFGSTGLSMNEINNNNNNNNKKFKPSEPLSIKIPCAHGSLLNDLCILCTREKENEQKTIEVAKLLTPQMIIDEKICRDYMEEHYYDLKHGQFITVDENGKVGVHDTYLAALNAKPIGKADWVCREFEWKCCRSE